MITTRRSFLASATLAAPALLLSQKSSPVLQFLPQLQKKPQRSLRLD
jgi:hypothetical protein